MAVGDRAVLRAHTLEAAEPRPVASDVERARRRYRSDEAPGGTGEDGAFVQLTARLAGD